MYVYIVFTFSGQFYRGQISNYYNTVRHRANLSSLLLLYCHNCPTTYTAPLGINIKLEQLFKLFITYAIIYTWVYYVV